MAKAATLEELQELHRLVAASLNATLTRDLADGVPTDAATLGASIKFLKDNSITADPAENADLDRLRNKLKAQVERRAIAGNVITLAQRDLDQMEG